MKKLSLSLVSCCLLLSAAACSSQQSNYDSEFQNIDTSVGQRDTSTMTKAELKQEIDRAYLDGELTAEEARKAHTQLDVKGHLTKEQIAVINRDRLAERHKYESKKETLDVYRDATRTGSSMTRDVNDIKKTLKDLFN